jgi:hypothetical protein
MEAISVRLGMLVSRAGTGARIARPVQVELQVKRIV